MFSRFSFNETKINFLIKENQELEKTNQNKSEFIAKIAHEIKNPLNLIIGYSNLLEISQKISKKELLENVSEIKKAGEEISDLVNDLLDVAQLNSGEFNIDKSQEIDIAEIIARSVRVNLCLARNRKINIKQNIQDNLPLINLDGKRMKQILVNLISNALKYSDQNTTITIEAKMVDGLRNKCGVTVSGKSFPKIVTPHLLRGSLDHDEDLQMLEITISDQGFGMTEDEIEIALEKYHTVNNPNRGKVDSFSLGLPLVKHLVELQNGEMKIESTKGKGTKVNLFFELSSVN